MKIIDKYKDYYDYVQNIYYDDTFTFDRRSAFYLHKSEIAAKFEYYLLDHSCLLLQICNTFWLISYKAILADGFNYKYNDFDITDVISWKDYTKDRKLLDFSLINFNYKYFINSNKNQNKDLVNLEKDLIIHNNYKVVHTFTDYPVFNDNNKETVYRKYPRLENTGLASFIPAEDIYYAIEEYFSAEKTANEKISSEPITDIEKAINHGFDKRTSFRTVK